MSIPLFCVDAFCVDKKEARGVWRQHKPNGYG
jgi:hypothetical protein